MGRSRDTRFTVARWTGLRDLPDNALCDRFPLFGEGGAPNSLRVPTPDGDKECRVGDRIVVWHDTGAVYVLPHEDELHYNLPNGKTPCTS